MRGQAKTMARVGTVKKWSQRPATSSTAQTVSVSQRMCAGAAPSNRPTTRLQEVATIRARRCFLVAVLVVLEWIPLFKLQHPLYVGSITLASALYAVNSRPGHFGDSPN